MLDAGAVFVQRNALLLAKVALATVGGVAFLVSPARAEPAAAESGELDEGVLDNLHLAGARFERMLKKLAG